MPRRRLDQIAAAVLVVVSLLVYFVLIPLQVPEDRLGLSASFFPELSALAIAGLGVLLFFKARLGRGAEGEALVFRLSRAEAARVGAVLGIMAGYLGLMYVAGFLLATPLAVAGLMYYSGQRRSIVLWPVTVLLPLVIFAFIEYGMKVLLPRGIIF